MACEPSGSSAPPQPLWCVICRCARLCHERKFAIAAGMDYSSPGFHGMLCVCGPCVTLHKLTRAFTCVRGRWHCTCTATTLPGIRATWNTGNLLVGLCNTYVQQFMVSRNTACASPWPPQARRPHADTFKQAPQLRVLHTTNSSQLLYHPVALQAPQQTVLQLTHAGNAMAALTHALLDYDTQE